MKTPAWMSTTSTAWAILTWGSEAGKAALRGRLRPIPTAPAPEDMRGNCPQSYRTQSGNGVGPGPDTEQEMRPQHGHPTTTATGRQRNRHPLGLWAPTPPHGQDLSHWIETPGRPLRKHSLFHQLQKGPDGSKKLRMGRQGHESTLSLSQKARGRRPGTTQAPSQ